MGQSRQGGEKGRGGDEKGTDDTEENEFLAIAQVKKLDDGT